MMCSSRIVALLRPERMPEIQYVSEARPVTRLRIHTGDVTESQHILVVQSLGCVQVFVTPWTVARQAPPSMGFSRQEYWSGVPVPCPRAARYLNIPPSVPSASQKQANKQQKILQLQTWRREWQSIPIFLPGEFHGQRNLGGYKVHGVAESDTT